MTSALSNAVLGNFIPTLRAAPWLVSLVRVIFFSLRKFLLLWTRSVCLRAIQRASLTIPWRFVSDAGSGSGTLRLRRKIPLLFVEGSLKTVCFDSFILKQVLKQTRSVCLRAF
jgi:hypothetical protein